MQVADKYALIRRLSYVLTGLPPSPENIMEFLSDNSPRAYESLVDNYLDSPAFGERWAGHWMDGVWYAETKNVHQVKQQIIEHFAAHWTKDFDKLPVQLAGNFEATASKDPKEGFYMLGDFRGQDLLGVDHKPLTNHFRDRDIRLTDVHENIEKEVLA